MIREIPEPSAKCPYDLLATLDSGERLYLGTEPTMRKALRRAVLYCARPDCRIVRIERWGKFIDSVCGEAVRINNAREREAEKRA